MSATTAASSTWQCSAMDSIGETPFNFSFMGWFFSVGLCENSQCTGLDRPAIHKDAAHG